MFKLATLCYVRRPGQTLMLHRVKKANDMHQGKWNGLGGKLEPGETPEACAIREIYEESGLRVTHPELRGFLTFPDFRPGESWYTFVFVCRHFTGGLIDSPEGVLQWIDDEALPTLNLWEGDRLFFPWLEENGRLFSGHFTYVQGRLTDHAVHWYPTLPPSPPVAFAPGFVDAAPSHGYRPIDDTYCWVCGGPVLKVHCKITCTACGFRRDCSDP